MRLPSTVGFCMLILLAPGPNAAAWAQDANACPVTSMPAAPFLPPVPYRAAPAPNSFWFGTNGLWTSLGMQGVWHSLSRREVDRSHRPDRGLLGDHQHPRRPVADLRSVRPALNVRTKRAASINYAFCERERARPFAVPRRRRNTNASDAPVPAKSSEDGSGAADNGAPRGDGVIGVPNASDTKKVSLLMKEASLCVSGACDVRTAK